MLRVILSHAEPGMVLALPVRHPQSPGRHLLNAGFKLNDQALGRLHQFDVGELWIRYPALDFLGKYVNQNVIEKRLDLTNKIRGAFESIQNQSSGKFQYEVYCQTVSQLIEQLLQDPSSILFLDEMAGHNRSLLEHASAVGYLSLLMGLKLDAYLIRQRKKLSPQHAKDVISLGVGAMLHDVGMLQLEEKVIRRQEEEPDFNDPEWRKHVPLGYELVRGQIGPTASVIILHHHQHYDGTGFPTRKTDDGKREALRGEQIHVFPRIVNVADTFDHLQHPRPGVTLPTVQVIKQMLEPPLVSRFDPEVLRAFLMVVPPYPPGTMVQLNNGQHAVAIDHSVEDPCHPTVQLIPDPTSLTRPDDEASQTPQEIIDLRERPDLAVVQCNGEDVASFNFPPPNLSFTHQAVA